MFTALCDGMFGTMGDGRFAAPCDDVFTTPWKESPRVPCAQRSQRERESWRSAPGEEAKMFQVEKSAAGGDSSELRLNQGASALGSLG